jgi:hypothetical protein
MRTIRLAETGYSAVVDDADFDLLSRFGWTLVRGGGKRQRLYAHANMKEGEKWQPVMMHRFLLQAPAGTQVDHRDNDGLNNRRSNLRLATGSQNRQNSASRIGSSRFKGVSWHKAAGKWVAVIKTDRQQRYLGLFVNELDAARAYDAAARELFGEFALPNFPATVPAAGV